MNVPTFIPYPETKCSVYIFNRVSHLRATDCVLLHDMSSFSVRNILNLKEPRMQANNNSNAMNLGVYQTDNVGYEPRSKLDMGLHLAQKTQEPSKFY